MPFPFVARQLSYSQIKSETVPNFNVQTQKNIFGFIQERQLSTTYSPNVSTNTTSMPKPIKEHYSRALIHRLHPLTPCQKIKFLKVESETIYLSTEEVE